MIDFNTIVAIIFVILAGLFAYVSSVIVHEQKTGKPVRLFWEKKEVIKPDPKKNPDLGKGKFDKQRVSYRPEDNTWQKKKNKKLATGLKVN